MPGGKYPRTAKTAPMLHPVNNHSNNYSSPTTYLTMSIQVFCVTKKTSTFRSRSNVVIRLLPARQKPAFGRLTDRSDFSGLRQIHYFPWREFVAHLLTRLELIARRTFRMKYAPWRSHQLDFCQCKWIHRRHLRDIPGIRIHRHDIGRSSHNTIAKHCALVASPGI